VDVGDKPAIVGTRRDQCEPEPAGVVAALEAGLLGHGADHDRRGAVVAHLRVLHREGAVLQAVAEAGQPLLASQAPAEAMWTTRRLLRVPALSRQRTPGCATRWDMVGSCLSGPGQPAAGLPHLFVRTYLGPR
jgi:hypothetical protein